MTSTPSTPSPHTPPLHDESLELRIPQALSLIAERGTATTPLLVDRTRGHRIELSGRVLVNWWAKNAGLLEMEFGIGPGYTVHLDVPPHWRTLPLALAALSLGATVTDHEESADLVITGNPSAHVSAPDVLAVTLEALAVSFPGEVPEGMVDHAAEVRAQPDALAFAAAAAAQAAWDVDGLDTTALEHMAYTEANDGAATSVSWLGVGGTAVQAEAARDATAGGWRSGDWRLGDWRLGDWSAAMASLLACRSEGSLVLLPLESLVEGKPTDSLCEQERITRAITTGVV
ncbi:TIGR03089 family protein [Pseudoglutamicibacter albus]|uniref:TIGR03089 family protein n=1 Tax=Pseudoglutamicibacter albus TaxID=98671 RepID=UPI0012EC51FE|nr:TIGR03089 family protein [Pseudoglutamicibacter albus]